MHKTKIVRIEEISQEIQNILTAKTIERAMRCTEPEILSGKTGAMVGL